MSDLIDRSKLPTIRISIPAYLCDERCRSVVEIVSEGFQTLIESAPTVDAVEVVRCKNCKHWIVDSYWHGNPDQVRACRVAGWMCGANGYCLYGEKE